MPILFGGGDESNNGRNYAIYVLVLSNNINDSSRGRYEKIRSNHGREKWNLRIGNRKFRFTISNEHPCSEKRDLLGRIYGSLLHEEIDDNVAQLKIFLDGSVSLRERAYIKSFIAESTSQDYSTITIRTEPYFDVHNVLVNKADRVANFLYRTKTLDELERDHRFKPMLDF